MCSHNLKHYEVYEGIFLIIFLYLDVDECCNLALNTCRQHICKNTIGSYYCECNQGYSLQTDNRTCESK